MSTGKQGMIFDIFRASMNDGPGIRTTVFFKGCPLRCKWCHNPESWSFLPQLSFVRDKCTDCMACAEVCPDGAHQMTDDRHTVAFELCKACGECTRVCPSGALKIVGTGRSVDELLAEIERDRDFYALSGGGVTLSGGEPMMQPDIALELLRKCKERGISTCVETCGYAPRQSYAAAMPYVDLFLFDYKSSDTDEHRRLTGVSDERIRSNLEFLYDGGSEIILRCPLIPGVNDSRRHFAGIAEMERRYPRLKGIEILPYHNMGVSKGTGIGLAMELKLLNTTDNWQKARWLSLFAEFGCEKAQIK